MNNEDKLKQAIAEMLDYTHDKLPKMNVINAISM